MKLFSFFPTWKILSVYCSDIVANLLIFHKFCWCFSHFCWPQNSPEMLVRNRPWLIPAELIVSIFRNLRTFSPRNVRSTHTRIHNNNDGTLWSQKHCRRKRIVCITGMRASHLFSYVLFAAYSDHACVLQDLEAGARVIELKGEIVAEADKYTLQIDADKHLFGSEGTKWVC